MPDYRQYVLGSHGHNADMLEQSCYNDPDARDQARPLADGRLLAADGRKAFTDASAARRCHAETPHGLEVEAAGGAFSVLADAHRRALRTDQPPDHVHHACTMGFDCRGVRRGIAMEFVVKNQVDGVDERHHRVGVQIAAQLTERDTAFQKFAIDFPRLFHDPQKPGACGTA